MKRCGGRAVLSSGTLEQPPARKEAAVPHARQVSSLKGSRTSGRFSIPAISHSSSSLPESQRPQTCVSVWEITLWLCLGQSHLSWRPLFYRLLLIVGLLPGAWGHSHELVTLTVLAVIQDRMPVGAKEVGHAGGSTCYLELLGGRDKVG